MKRLIKSTFGFLSAVASVALLYALLDSLISGIWPQFNGIMVYRFAEFFPRSLGIYFLFILPLAAVGLPLYFVSKRLPGLRARELKPVYSAVGIAVSLIIPIILFEVPNKLSLSYFEPVFLAADAVGLILIGLFTVYIVPLLLSLAAGRLPSFMRKTVGVAGYLTLALIFITLFSLTALPELTRRPYNPEAPNLLVISIDTLRKDHLSYYGYDKIETPNIDAFLKSATTFDNAYCSSPWTLPSLASFLTGYRPSVCGVDAINGMSRDIETLPGVLKRKGYRTECYITNFVVYPEQGFGRGFDVYLNAEDVPLLLRFKGTRMYRISSALYTSIRIKSGAYLSYPEFNRSVTINSLERQTDRPFFIWCHFLDPHSVYAPPSEYIPDYPGVPSAEAEEYLHDSMINGWDYSERNKTGLLMLYDGEIVYVDEQVGLILDAFEESEYAENTIIVMFNDHGEEFWDHGRWSHGYSVYPEVIDMVFAIRDPSLMEQPRQCNNNVTHIDIMPTLLDALGIEIPERIQGDSYYPILSGETVFGKSAFCEYTSYGQEEIKAIRRGGYLYSRNMDTEEIELYDLNDDPQGLYDLSGKCPDIEVELSRVLDNTIKENEETKSYFRYDDEITLPKSRVEKLRSLGYMGN